MRDIFEQIADDIAKGPVDAVQAAREHTKRNLPKRFYERVSVELKDDVFAVLLDGRSIKTPGRNALVFKDEVIAEGVAAEWELQEEEIDPGTMPLTRIAHSAIDAVEENLPRLQMRSPVMPGMTISVTVLTLLLNLLVVRLRSGILF